MFPLHWVLICQWRVRVRNNDHEISTGRYLYGYGFFWRKFGTGKVWVNVIFEFFNTEKIWVNKKSGKKVRVRVWVKVK